MEITTINPIFHKAFPQSTQFLGGADITFMMAWCNSVNEEWIVLTLWSCCNERLFYYYGCDLKAGHWWVLDFVVIARIDSRLVLIRGNGRSIYMNKHAWALWEMLGHYIYYISVKLQWIGVQGRWKYKYVNPTPWLWPVLFGWDSLPWFGVYGNAHAVILEEIMRHPKERMGREIQGCAAYSCTYRKYTDYPLVFYKSWTHSAEDQILCKTFLFFDVSCCTNHHKSVVYQRE